MKLFFLFLGLLLSSQAFTQDCIGMADGAVVRIDEPGKSLGKFAVQDQDGLGTCYANAASLLLQGNLENNPEVSYIHLASIYKTEELEQERKNSSSSCSDSSGSGAKCSSSIFNIYAKEANDPNKAINGGGLAMKWDLAIDGGHTCDVVRRAQELQEKKKKPVVCSKNGMNLEKILVGGDTEHRQFKTVLQSSIYMNIFQKTFGDLNEKPNFFEKKKIQARKEKYEKFKASFEALVEAKKKKIREQDCNRVNADHLSPIVAPLTQAALGYRACFKSDFVSKDEYWCKIARGLVHNPKVNADGSVEVEGADPAWLARLQKKIVNKKEPFTPYAFGNDVIDSLIEGLGLKSYEVNYARDHLRAIMTKSNQYGNNINSLGDEYNEIKGKGFSEACVKRNTYNYFSTKDFENDWKSDAFLCKESELLLQATNVIVNYKESGLNDLDAALKFLSTSAGADYDTAMMSLYATDCDDAAKLEIPQNITCHTTNVKHEDKNITNATLLDKLNRNKPIVANMCSAILKKPKADFQANECGYHALGITGMRCVKGKFEYLIQNSWGANSKAENTAIKTEEGKGAYWFDEQTFFDSVYSVEYLKTRE